MSWGNYDQRPDGYRPVPGSDPYGRAYDSSVPSSYVTHDPYAIPVYHRPGYVPLVMSFFPCRPEGVKYDIPNVPQPA